MKRSVKRLIAGIISAAMALSSASVFAEVLPNDNYDAEVSAFAKDNDIADTFEDTEIEEHMAVSESNEAQLTLDELNNIDDGDYSQYTDPIELNVTLEEGVRYYFKGSSGAYFYILGNCLYIKATKSGSSLYNSSDMSSTTKQYWNKAKNDSSILYVDIYDVKGIPKGMFSGWKYLEAVTVYDEIEYIGVGAFQSCNHLENVLISGMKGSGVIRAGVFEHCTQLTNVYLYEGVKSIGQAAFNGTDIKNLTLPDGLENIGIHAFADSGLETVNIPSSVNEIGTGAFMGTKLETIKIPDTVEAVYCEAFADCENLKTVYLSSKTKFLSRTGGTIERTYGYSNRYPFANTSADLYIDGYETTNSKAPWGSSGNVYWLRSLEAESIKDYYYYGTAIEPEIVVNEKNTQTGEIINTLEKDVDYRVSYINNDAVGEATVNVTFIGDYGYSPDKEFSFNILNPILEIQPIDDQLYVGEDVKPKVVIEDKTSNTTLTENIDYIVSYSNNAGVGVGIANITYAGRYAGYTGDAKSVEFNIREWDISLIPDGSIDVNDVEWIINNQVYNYYGDGSKIYYNDVYGVYTITIDGVDYRYNLVASDMYPIDFEITDNYENNQGVGIATIEIEGRGKFFGSTTQNFNIIPFDLGTLNDNYIIAINSLDCDYISNFTYTGDLIYPSEIESSINYFEFDGVLLQSGYYNGNGEFVGRNGQEDYIEGYYENNLNVGEARIVIEGKGKNIVGKYIHTFKINPANLFDLVDEGKIDITNNYTQSELSYKGKPIEPQYTLVYNKHELIPNTDYTIEYENNDSPGKARAVISGIGNFTDSFAINFEITKIDISSATVTIDASENDLMYRNVPNTPNVIVEFDGEILVEGMDYELTYENNNAAGTAKAVVTGIGNYEGETFAEYIITPYISGQWDKDFDISKAMVSVSESYTYDGTEHEPIPTVIYHYVDDYNPEHPIEGDVELVKGEDYVVSYEDNVEAGTAYVIVSGIGKFETEDKEKVGKGRFDISTHSIFSDDISFVINDTEFNKNSQFVEPIIKFGDIELVKGVDYSLDYGDDCINAGQHTIKISGIGNFGDDVEKTFTITPRNGSLFVYYLIFFDENEDD